MSVAAPPDRAEFEVFARDPNPTVSLVKSPLRAALRIVSLP
jgi:hypothetical protein